MSTPNIPAVIERFDQRRPRLMGLLIVILMLFVILVELMSTDAPLVLYQAF